MMHSVTINGKKYDFREGIALSELIERLKLPDSRIAVELNKSVVRKGDWSKTPVSDSDVVEIVHFVGGG